MKVIQLNKLFKSKRASILLVTLSTTVLLFFFSVAIFNIYRNASYLRIRESRYMKANWASRSVLALLANKISQSSDIFISLQEHKKLSWGEFQKTLTVNEKKKLYQIWEICRGSYQSLRVLIRVCISCNINQKLGGFVKRAHC